MQLEPPEASVYLPRKPLHVGFSSIRELLSSRLAKESGRSPKELSKNISLRSLQPVGDHLPVMRPGEHLLLGQVRSGEAPGVVEAFKQELERSFSTAAFRVVEEVYRVILVAKECPLAACLDVLLRAAVQDLVLRAE